MTSEPKTETIASILVAGFMGLFYAFLFTSIAWLMGTWGATVHVDGWLVTLVGTVGGLGFLHGWRSRDKTPM
jgi:hypothetical protein